MAEHMVREPLSGINILIAGSFKILNAILALIPLHVEGGLAGLTAVIICYRKALGISTHHGINVRDYSETAEKGFAILEDGSKPEADIVIGAEGVGCWCGKKEEPVSSGSGYAIYRPAVPLKHALKNPELAKVYDEKPHVTVHVGYNTHVVADWSKTQSSDRVLRYVKDWGSIVPTLVNSVPNKEVIDWRLMWRNPQPNASGATMAMEDGITLAACLHISGKNHIPLVARVYNKLREWGLRCVNSGTTRIGMLFMKNPNPLNRIVDNWLPKNNPEQYSYDNHAACVKNIIEGAPLTNITHIQDLLQAAKEGRDVLNAGDWS
ncbi:hypothetical protein IW261DRAFT_1588406 [Armillaria novae-zelandiae]|uniref:Uncharacterized protein n=1 Tax=Armillaria novae-zelandiae TaxID=153914 RepID=A0AA39PV63_9AGAR|nr:hypothetical protein IW261DRAFT_1588406 [Armillaria novae-zelandiae]